MTARTRPGLPLVAAGILPGVLMVVIGIAVLGRVDSAFGTVWAAGLVLVGVIVIGSWLSLRRRPQQGSPARSERLDDEPATFHPRGVAGTSTQMLLLVTSALGLWCLAIAVVGAAEESWLWGVLGGIPAIYFGGFPVWWLTGRLRPGGVWVTATRVVDEHLGVRRELRIADIDRLSPQSEALRITVRGGAEVVVRRRAPRPWRAGDTTTPEMVVSTVDIDADSRLLAGEILPRLDRGAGR